MKAILEALKASSITAWELDVPSGRVLLSPEWAQMLGDPAAPLETTLAELEGMVKDEDRASVRRAFELAIKGDHDVYSVEHRVAHNGREFWVLSVGRVLSRDSNGRAVRLAGTNTDISVVKRAQEAVSTSLAHLYLVLDSSPAYIVYVDRDLVVRFHNRAYRTLALAEGPIDGRHVAEVLGQEVFQAVEADIRRVLEGETVTMERSMPLRDGRTIHLAGQYVPHRDEKGRVLGFVATLGDVSDLKRAHEELKLLASTDPLTGLANRRSFEARLERDLALAKRQGFRVGLIYLDLDRFKPVNDEFGHAAGDRVLSEVGARLRALVRSADTVARLGGDEFALILNGVADGAAVVSKAERVRAAIEQPMAIEGREVSVSATLGVALYPDDAGDSGPLIRCADDAMYQGKKTRRGIVVSARDCAADEVTG